MRSLASANRLNRKSPIAAGRFQPSCVLLLAIGIAACGDSSSETDAKVFGYAVTVSSDNTTWLHALTAADAAVDVSTRRFDEVSGFTAELVIQSDEQADADLVLQDRLTGQVVLLLNNREVIPLDLPGGQSLRDSELIDAQDVNGNGRDELLWFNRLDGRLTLWFLEGAEILRVEHGATLESNELQPLGLIRRGPGRQPHLLLNDRAAREFQLRPFAPEGEAVVLKSAPRSFFWRPVAIVDLDEDGWSDLIMRDESKGVIERWLLDEGGVAERSMLGQMPFEQRAISLMGRDPGISEAISHDARSGRLFRLDLTTGDSVPLEAEGLRVRGAPRFPRLLGASRFPGAIHGSLPNWFSENRVHGHTRLGPIAPRGCGETVYLDTPEFKQGPALARALGFNVWTRHFIACDENPWWPSRLPDAELYLRRRLNRGATVEAGRDIAKEIVASARAAEIEQIGYVWIMSDRRYADNHPEWKCHDRNGAVAANPQRGELLDITGPYREVVLTRLQELSRRGVTVYYFDNRHLPAGGCYGSSLEAKYATRSGRRAPTFRNDPAFIEWETFTAIEVENTFRYWLAALKEENPEAAFLISTTTLPGLFMPTMRSDLAAISVPKTEFDIALRPGMNRRLFERHPELLPPDRSTAIAAGFTLLRASANDRPPHVWASGYPDANHARAAVGAITAFGGIAAIDIREHNLFRDDDPTDGTPRAALQEAAALGEQISDAFRRTRSYPGIAVLFSEQARNSFGIDSAGVWEQLLASTVGAFGAGAQLAPTTLVAGRTLEDTFPDSVQILIAPPAAALNSIPASMLHDFRERGGKVLTIDDPQRWAYEGSIEEARSALEADLRAVAVRLPFRLDGGDRKLFIQAYRSSAEPSRYVLAVVDDFGWVQTVPANELEQVSLPNERVTAGVRIVVDPVQLGYSREISCRINAQNALEGDSIERHLHEDRQLIELVLPAFEAFLFIELRFDSSQASIC